MCKKLKKFYSDISIKYKLLLIFNLMVIIPLIIIQLVYYKKSSEVIENKSINYSQDLLKSIEFRLENYTENIKNESNKLLYDKRIYNILQSHSKCNGIYNNSNNIDDIKSVGDVKAALRQVALLNREIQSICIISNDKTFYAYDASSGRVNIESIIPYEEILKQARQAAGKPIWYFQERDNKVDNIFLARLVNDPYTLEEIGLIAIVANKNFLESIYKNLCTDSMKNIFIVSGDGKIISSNEDIENLSTEFNKKNSKDRIGYYVNSKDKMLVSYVSLENTEWSVFTYIPLSKLYKEINDLKEWLIILLIVIVIFVSVFSLLVSIDIINPINNLVRGMKKVEKGEEFEKILIDRNDELGYLGKTFNKMAENINHLTKWILVEQLTRKEAEIKALQAQINPHFLFNTLESINWMALLNGVPEISEMVSSLASLMEVNIGRDNKLISLRDEFKYIEDYISIVKKRYEERLEVKSHIDEDVLGVEIPRLLIQPLVENAIDHGVEKSKNKVTISLKACRVDDYVRIEILDDGMGIKKEELEELNKRFQIKDSDYFRNSQNEKRKSIGLENVNRRLKLFYGEEYGLEILSEYMEFTMVVVRIPTKIMNKEG